jgi:hypothetical protein
MVDELHPAHDMLARGGLATHFESDGAQIFTGSVIRVTDVRNEYRDQDW